MTRLIASKIIVVAYKNTTTFIVGAFIYSNAAG
jgi:hypothetical protein